MAISINNNAVDTCEGDFVKGEVPPDIDLDISGNQATNLKGSFVNLQVQKLQKVRYSSQMIYAFVEEAAKHFHELTPAQMKQFNYAIKNLRATDPQERFSAVTWLYQLSIEIPATVIAGLIAKFFSSAIVSN
jgi:hypothetical protein